MSRPSIQPPFVWPEPPVAAQRDSYEYQIPIEGLVQEADSLFGILLAPSRRAVGSLQRWLECRSSLRIRLIVAVYPTCATGEADLLALLDLATRDPDRLSVRVHPLRSVTDRATNTLCFLTTSSQTVQVVTGPSEGFNGNRPQPGNVNLVFRADPMLAEAFGEYFDWLWTVSRDITTQGVVSIPNLVLPEGTDEGTRLWDNYLGRFGYAEEGPPAAPADRLPADEASFIEGQEEPKAPTEELGLARIDPIAKQVARLYEKGALVSIDKLSRIPPLDAPLDPGIFGDASELQRGSITRTIRMRVSVIDERTLKEIDRRRRGIRSLLNRFTYGLADNIRWMPDKARQLFDLELERANAEGEKLVADLLKGNGDAFVEEKIEALAEDIRNMHRELGRPGEVTPEIVKVIVSELKRRLSKAQCARFMPMLSYTTLSFRPTESGSASPWGQAYSFLSDLAAYPRKALTDSFFFRGLKVSEDELFNAMNIAEDAVCRDRYTPGIKDRCRRELDVLALIEGTALEARKRCDLTLRVVAGDPIEAILGELPLKGGSA